MVHALKEAWRVLIPRGIMIDLRPLCVDGPVDIFYQDQNETAGMVDMSPDLVHELAADHAIDSVVKEGLYDKLWMEQFELAYYWKNVRGMLAEMRARWMDDVIIDDRVIQRAYELFGRHGGQKKVRLLFRMQLTKYEKQGASTESTN
jgi:hypothetical protein